MPTSISPSCGRVVLFQPGPQDLLDGSIVRNDTTNPMPATVAYVNSDGTVNLAVFDHAGKPFARNNVQLVQDGQSKPTETLTNEEGEGYTAVSRHCYWMQYQIDQQAKANAAVAAPATTPTTTAGADAA